MKKNLTQFYLAIVLICFVFSSCNKNNENFDSGNMPTTIELPLAAYAGPAAYDTGGFIYGITDSISSTPQALETVVFATGSKPLSKAVTVTLTVDNPALTRLNAAHKALYLSDSATAVRDTTDLPDPTNPKYTIYTPLPASAYKIQSSTVTIAAGTSKASYIVNITSSNLIFGTAYMLPISITDAQGQTISYYKSVYYTIGLKSPYEADYTANGTISFPDPSSNRGWTNRDKELTTVNANTVRAEAADLGGSNYYMYLTVNPDNSVTVKSAPDAANLTIQNNGPCTYDPTTKTYTLNYLYVGGTGNRVISETIQRNN